MLTRIITSIVATAVLIPVLIFSDTVVFPIALAIVAVVSMFEILTCIGMKKRISLVLPMYVFAAAFPFLMRYMSAKQTAMIAFLAATLYVIYLFAHVVWSHGAIPFSDGAAFFTLAIYILTAITCIVYVRDFSQGGKYLYLLIFMGAWITDIFAYFTGYFIGKHKLIEDVSPKKTVEGSIGGIVFCALSFAVFGWVVNGFFGQNANVLFLTVSGVIISVISQIGDLIMSVIKRHYKIKDFGQIFPGHGGMLDRFDSILAVALGLAAICVFSTLTNIPIM